MRRIRAPKCVHTLISGTCEFVVFHGKRNLANGVKVMDVKAHNGYIKWNQCNHMGTKSWKRETEQLERYWKRRGGGNSSVRLHLLLFTLKKEEWGHKPKEMWWPLESGTSSQQTAKTGKQGISVLHIQGTKFCQQPEWEKDSLLEPLERNYSCQHLDFSLWRHMLDFWPTNSKIMHLCCFKPPSLSWFVTATIENLM